jgi:hypothetical protein
MRTPVTNSRGILLFAFGVCLYVGVAVGFLLGRVL